MHRPSYYVRKKILHPFTQDTFLVSNKFIEFLKKHDIHITKGELERFEKEGWLQPVFRTVLTNEQQKQTLSTGILRIKKFHGDRMVEFPKKKDYKPWKNFLADQKKGEWHDKKLMYYHPFQIMQVLHIIKTMKSSFMWYSFNTEQYIQDNLEFVRNIKMYPDKEAFKKSIESLATQIGFLMMLEEPYRFNAFGKSLSSGFDIDSWVKWMQKRFSPQNLIQDLDLSLTDIKELHRQITLNGYSMDPLDRWFDLTRIMRPSILDKLTGKARTAQFYYSIARMLFILYYDLTKKALPEPDVIFDASHGEWKKNIYSNPFDYATIRTQRGIIRYFVRDITTRIFFLVEGDTEEKVIEKIFDRLDISMQYDGINVINCHGIRNMNAKKLDEIIKTANRDYIHMYVLVDNEENSVHKVDQIKKKIHTDFGFHKWETSFEEDNFGRQEVINWFNSYLSKHDRKITDLEIDAQQDNNAALVRAIEKAYKAKYKNNIYHAIQKKKPDISLELIKPRLGKISPRGMSGKQSEIETILGEVFKMVPNWG